MADTSQIGLNARFQFVILLIFLPFFVISFAGYMFIQESIEKFEETSNELFSEIAPAYRLVSLLNEPSLAIHDYILDHRPDDLKRFYEKKTEIEITFRSFTNSTIFNMEKERRLLRDAETTWQQASAVAEELVRLRDVEGKVNLASLSTDRLDELTFKTSQSLQTLIFLMKEEVIEEKKSIDRMERTYLMIFGFLFLFGTLLFLSAVTLFRKIVTRPIVMLNKTATEWGRGNLTLRIDEKLPGELGQLARTFNAMAGKLAESYKTLELMASRDDLTGLLNSREFHNRLGQEISRAERYGHSLSLILLDLDHFKVVNDTHGHPAGDAALKASADLVVSCVRPSDQVVRYGGEEFAVICPETSPEEAGNLAERIRKSFQDHILDVRGIPVRLTVSLGVAGYPEHDHSVAGLMEKADKALYQAKREGRNKSCIAVSPPS